MAVVSSARGNQTTVIGTEHSLTQQTGVGIYELFVDLTAMAFGDTLIVRVKSKHPDGAVSKTAYAITYTDTQPEPHKYSIPIPIDVEIIVSIQQTTGLPRTYLWNLLRA